jgi:hypothetical protein
VVRLMFVNIPKHTTVFNNKRLIKGGCQNSSRNVAPRGFTACPATWLGGKSV